MRELRAKLRVGSAMGQARAGHDTYVIAVGRLRFWPPGKPDRTTSRCAEPHASTPGTAGMEGAGETCRGTRGRWQGLTGLHDNAPSHTPARPAPLVRRAPEGPEGTGGLRGAAPNEVRPPSLAGGRTRVGRSQPQASPDWRPPRGLRGLAGLRDDAPSNVSD